MRIKELISDLRFVGNNILHPYDRITVRVGTGEIADRWRGYFNHRSWKRLFIPLKKYNCAVIPLSQFLDYEGYIKSVKGKNSADYFSRRSQKLGYCWEIFDANKYTEAIFEINTSASQRQGRMMDAGYLKEVTHWPNDENNIWVGVFDEHHQLVSYIWLVISGELALMNRILGHQLHLSNNIMYLNCIGAISYLFERNPRLNVMYDTFGRKNNGLVLFKKRIGFKPYTIDFL